MTALRELADRWIEKGRICKQEGSPVSGTQLIECAAELLSILDAEGDGGAMGYQFRVAISGKAKGEWSHCSKQAHDAMTAIPDNYETRQLYTQPQPVRTGVVGEVEKTIDALLKEIGESDKDSRIRVSTVRFHIKKLLAAIKSQGESNV